MKRAAVKGLVPLTRCKVLTNESRLKSSRLIFYEKRSSRFIASGLQTSSVRHLYGHIILAAQCSSTAREAKKRRLDKSYDKWCPCFWFFAQLSKYEKKPEKEICPETKCFLLVPNPPNNFCLRKRLQSWCLVDFIFFVNVNSSLHHWCLLPVKTISLNPPEKKWPVSLFSL